MTVSTTDSVVEYVSGGPAFPIPYRFLQNSDIEAVLVKQDGTSETLTGAQYTLSGAGSQNGGTLTSSYAAGFLGVAGASLTISRIMDAVQPTDLRNQGKFLAETHETVFDRLTMLIQQGFSWLRRALVRPVGKNYYDAESRQIKNLADPTQQQDAATMGWTDRFVGSLLSAITGPINNAANIFYLGPDGTSHVVQDLSGPAGSGLVGHNEALSFPPGTVGSRLKALTQAIADVITEIDNLDAADISYGQQTGVRADLVSSALDFLGRSGKEGIFVTPASLGHRVGRLAYRVTAGGKAELISDLYKFYPSGAFVEPSTVASTGLKAYYVKPGGNNASAGTDWASALASVATALAKSDVDVVFVAAGVYVTGSHMGVYAGTRNVSIDRKSVV